MRTSSGVYLRVDESGSRRLGQLWQSSILIFLRAVWAGSGLSSFFFAAISGKV
jgi:hypothetical protein